MEPVYVGWLSIIPPILAITLALITKEVIISLVLGILSGTLIYTAAMGKIPVPPGIPPRQRHIPLSPSQCSILSFL